MSRPQEFPVDLPGPAGQERALRWTAIVIGVATLSLALTNANAITSWGAEQTPGPRVAQLLERADRWRETTDSVGLGAPRATMHRIWKKIEEARWSPEDGVGAA
ncbi:MAG: hypothetical protein WC729_10440 [Sphingomonas sp.]|jgi:hypothetical protein|uniref:hypothetical protein n=1 Tax=Sphingomonas sp. TaxID=28214 RepID=UPI0035625BBA